MKQRSAWWTAAALAVAAAGLGAGARVASPTFVGVGGALKDDNEAVFKALLARSDTGKIVIVPYASADAEAAGKSSTERFKKFRPDAKCLVMPDASKGEAEKKLAAEWIAHADLVWFTGGDQSRLISRFYDGDRPNIVLEALRDGMLKWDTRVGGTSAGCACLSDPMFTGGGSEGALGGVAKANPATEEEAPKPGRPPGVQTGRGLGLIPGVIMDSHFAQRGRVGRMVAALEQSGLRLGVGVNENRAVEVTGGSFRGIGDAAALVVDTRELKREGLTRLGTRVSLLSDGDVCRATGSGAAASYAFEMRGTPANPAAQGPPAVAKAWDKNVVLDMLRSLAAAPDSTQKATTDTFEVVISADERTKFFARAGDPATLGVVEARMDIRARAPAAPPSPAPTPAREGR